MVAPRTKAEIEAMSRFGLHGKMRALPRWTMARFWRG